MIKIYFLKSCLMISSKNFAISPLNLSLLNILMWIFLNTFHGPRILMSEFVITFYLCLFLCFRHKMKSSWLFKALLFVCMLCFRCNLNPLEHFLNDFHAHSKDQWVKWGIKEANTGGNDGEWGDSMLSKGDKTVHRDDCLSRSLK